MGHSPVSTITASNNRWLEHNEEVLYATESFVSVALEDIAELKRRADASARGRCRLCLHENAGAALHDMIIALRRGAYDRPHRHLNRAETLIALEGQARCLRFSEDGTPTANIRFSAAATAAGARVLRMPAGAYHALLVESDCLVFCESTLGPFDHTASEAAPWSPVSDDSAAVERYLAELRHWATSRA